jgi:hypothetical protein
MGSDGQMCGWDITVCTIHTPVYVDLYEYTLCACIGPDVHTCTNIQSVHTYIWLYSQTKQTQRYWRSNTLTISVGNRRITNKSYFGSHDNTYSVKFILQTQVVVSNLVLLPLTAKLKAKNIFQELSCTYGTVKFHRYIQIYSSTKQWWNYGND